MKGMVLISAIALAGCAPKQASQAQADEIARDAAEHHALVAAMEQHPALSENQAGAATGAPLVLDKTVKPRPPGVEPAPHPHAPDRPHRH